MLKRIPCSLADLKLNSSVLEGLVANFPHVEKLTSIQTAALEVFRQQQRRRRSRADCGAGTATLIAAETGAGKTLAFLLPVLGELAERNSSSPLVEAPGRPVGLVLSPTRELSLQTEKIARSLVSKTLPRVRVQSLDKLCIKSSASFGNEWAGRRRKPEKGLAGGVDIIFGTLGGLQKARAKKALFYSSLRHVVIDEADEIVSGRGFGEEMTKFVTEMKLRRSVETSVAGNCHWTFCGATIAPHVERRLQAISQDLQLELHTVKSRDLHKVADARRVRPEFYGVRPVSKDAQVSSGHSDRNTKMQDLLRIISHRRSKWKKMIVFCNTVSCAQFVKRSLSLRVSEYKDNNKIHAIHRDMHGHDRLEAALQFANVESRSRGSIFVCTDVAARGLDDRSLDCIVLFDLPTTTQDYLHRVGRVRGKGRVIAFFTRKNEKLARQLFSAHAHQISMMNDNGSVESIRSGNSGSCGIWKDI